MIQGGTYLYYFNSWILQKGGYLEVLWGALRCGFWFVVVLGILAQSFHKNDVFEK